MINEARALQAKQFIEGLKHTKGEFAGKPFILTKWQWDRIIQPLFGTLNKDGSRQYRTAYIELPRKQGKTTLAAGIALYLTFGDGEYGAEIYSAANDREQASLVFNEAADMVRQTGLAKHAKVIDSTKRIVFYKRNSFYRAISAEAFTKWGYNAHGIIYDELHAAPNRELWDVLTTSQGARRQPLIVVITTAGYDRNSICWELHDYAKKVEQGIVKDKTFLPVIYAAGDDDNWLDEGVWAQANPALMVKGNENAFRQIDEIRMLAKRAQETPALEMTFRRLYLNQWVNSSERWLKMDTWDSCNGKVEAEDGRTCYAGLDLSSTTDLTALALDFPREDGTHDAMMRYWIPEDTAVEKEKKDRVPYRLWAKQGFITLTPGNVIDYDFILQELLQLRQKYNIAEIAFDRWGATKLVQDLIDEGFTTIPFGQGFASMSAPTKELMTLALSKKIRHGGHPVLRWNADNLVVQMDPAGNLKPDKVKATQKIDGMVALIMALDRAVRHGNQVEKSKYEAEGITIL